MPQKRILLLYFDSSSLPIAKTSKIKVFLKVSLVSLTLRNSALCFKIFEKNEGSFAMLVHHERMGSLYVLLSI